MIKKKISIKRFEFVFISRNYWDKEEMEMKPWSEEFKEFHLGMMFNRFKISKSTSYLIGINLLVIKMWGVFTFSSK